MIRQFHVLCEHREKRIVVSEQSGCQPFRVRRRVNTGRQIHDPGHGVDAFYLELNETNMIQAARVAKQTKNVDMVAVVEWIHRLRTISSQDRLVLFTGFVKSVVFDEEPIEDGEPEHSVNMSLRPLMEALGLGGLLSSHVAFRFANINTATEVGF